MLPVSYADQESIAGKKVVASADISSYDTFPPIDILKGDIGMVHRVSFLLEVPEIVWDRSPLAVTLIPWNSIELVS